MGRIKALSQHTSPQLVSAEQPSQRELSRERSKTVLCILRDPYPLVNGPRKSSVSAYPGAEDGSEVAQIHHPPVHMIFAFSCPGLSLSRLPIGGRWEGVESA